MSRLSGSLEKCTFTLIAQLVKNHLQRKRPRFDSWVRMIRWKGAGYPVFWPGEFHGLHSPWGCKELDTTEKVSLSLFKETIRPFPKWFSSVQFLSRVLLFATAWTIAHQASPTMGFSRQQYWSGLPLPSPGDLPNPGIKPASPALQADALPSEPPGKINISFKYIKK